MIACGHKNGSYGINFVLMQMFFICDFTGKHFAIQHPVVQSSVKRSVAIPHAMEVVYSNSSVPHHKDFSVLGESFGCRKMVGGYLYPHYE